MGPKLLFKREELANTSFATWTNHQKNSIFCSKIPDKIHKVVGSLRLLEPLLTQASTGLG
jgi:hypothetical protein